MVWKMDSLWALSWQQRGRFTVHAAYPLLIDRRGRSGARPGAAICTAGAAIDALDSLQERVVGLRSRGISPVKCVIDLAVVLIG